MQQLKEFRGNSVGFVHYSRPLSPGEAIPQPLGWAAQLAACKNLPEPEPVDEAPEVEAEAEDTDDF